MDVQDRRVQDDMQRSLEVKLITFIQEAIKSGLHPDRAFSAAWNVCDQERTLKKSRDAAARSYL